MSASDGVDLDEPRPPLDAMEPVQDPIDWEAQGEGGAELDGELNELRSPARGSERHSFRIDGWVLSMRSTDSKDWQPSLPR